MNDSLRIMQIAERKVAECKGDYYRHHYCDLCPSKHVLSHYDKETGKYFDIFSCYRVKR